MMERKCCAHFTEGMRTLDKKNTAAVHRYNMLQAAAAWNCRLVERCGEAKKWWWRQRPNPQKRGQVFFQVCAPLNDIASIIEREGSRLGVGWGCAVEPSAQELGASDSGLRSSASRRASRRMSCLTKSSVVLWMPGRRLGIIGASSPAA